jgi:hypothetical protein
MVRGALKPCKNLIMFDVPIDETSEESIIKFVNDFSRLGDIPNLIKPELTAFKKTSHKLGPNSVVGAIQYSMNMSKNLVLCHLEMSNAE